MTLKLTTIICSTRPTRQGHKVGEWFQDFAAGHGGFEATLVDLAKLDLPMFNEPKHPRFGEYEHEHTKRWSAIVAPADAYVFVTPEYDYFASPAFVNALVYLSKEWAYKPAGLVTYGGISGGLRAAQAEKLLITGLNMMPIQQGVPVPMFTQLIGDDGIFRPNEQIVGGAKLMLDELVKWAGALKPMRQ